MATFKAKLIVDKRHSQYQRYAIIFAIITSSIEGFLFTFLSESLFNSTVVSVGFIVAGASLVYVYYHGIKNARKIREAYGDNKIEINDAGIKIGERKIYAEEINSVIAVDPEIVAKQGETVSDLIKVLKGKALPYCIKIETENGWERFDFLFESHYMGVQLMKILKAWRERQIPVTFIEEYSGDMLAYPDSELST